ncbi:T9SS type A sorting domain-containing protein [Hymenobacter convexus]|uniref:T9SS type A sorting domain-containing protein n=1 Tax=Hymenobacter sp. CA1UV-4 TaxID=3063782 RepID=UPI002713D167|nr:T9SS type A sorting domain-containing protein [Hymenobacter sp. CA1UV-4]MDO7854265.1 T9SS type A sorting domain-containing protein [Hymenobacter sp. CA1UV-4]
MKKNLLSSLLLFLALLGLTRPARATAPPAATPSLATALNPDGTLRPGVSGSFDARKFRMSTAPDGRPVFRPASTKGAGDERWQDGFGLTNGAAYIVRTVVQAGTDIYVGGEFMAVGNVAANRVARWNGTAWSALGTGTNNGMNGYVYALAVASNGDLYAGGTFNQAGGAPASCIARWNGTAWSSLGTGTANGVDAYVYALAIASNGDVYAGGAFNRAGGAPANRMARWDGTAWSPLGAGMSSSNGTTGYVYALALAGNGDLYAGGAFTHAGGALANRVARWNGVAWNPLGAGLGGGVSQDVEALAVASNGDVYAGGYFTLASGVPANYIARWNGTAWSALGTGTGASNGVNYTVFALAVAGNGDVYAGGYFVQAGGAPTCRVARWNGTAWTSLGTGAGNAAGDVVRALAVTGNGDVYAGGFFTQADGVPANSIVRWNGSVWNPLGAGADKGMNNDVSALAVAGNGDVYVGGFFTQVGGTPANYIARWNGTAWTSLGTGAGNGVNNGVRALAVASNGDVYAGGYFTQAGGAPANYIARWNGTAWSSLGAGTGTGNGVESFVYALAMAGNGDVYVGGRFTQAGGAPANRVARWNGTAWTSLGTGAGNGMNNDVTALAVAGNGDVYACGYFTQAGGASANYIARWNGTGWNSLGTGTSNGLNNQTYALAVAGNGDVYAGGYFTQAGGAAATRVARWNGTAWSPLGAGLGNGVYSSTYGYGGALVVAGNGDVYVGGLFTPAGGGPANNIARWNGTAWSSLGTGTNDIVSGLATGPTGKLYAGGLFATTGDGSKVMAHFAVYDPNAPLAAATAKAAPVAQLFPNPAHGAATLRLPVGAPRLPISLSNALGQVVRRYPAPTTAEAALDLRGLPAGAYVVRYGEYTQRLVVE